MTKDFKSLKILLDISLLLVIFEILSYDPKSDITYWLQENVQWITDKIFGEKIYGCKWIRLFLLALLY